MQRAAFQAPDTPRPTTGTDPALEQPARPADTVDVDLTPRTTPDTSPVTVLSPEELERLQANIPKFSALLNPVIPEADQAEAAGLPAGSRPYLINPPQALTLALMNSRPYQFRLEELYLESLAVTLQRFNFEPQFFAGMSPVTGVPQFNGGGLGGPGGGGTGFGGVNPPNSFTYRTREAPGGQESTLRLGTVAGFGKLFMFGGRLVGAFANQTVFNFVGPNPRQPTVQSTLPLTFVQPFLRGGGRAVTLEPLTAAERNLVYEVRSFARFRQQFIPHILTSTQAFGTTTALDNPGTAEPNIGYMTILLQLQRVENDRRNVASFEQILTVFEELAGSPASGLASLQIDQVNRSLQQARQFLIQDETTYRNNLDQFKIQLGLPPDTPLILDRQIIQPFRAVFAQLDVWARREERNPDELPPIIARLPELEDVVIDGRSLFAIPAKEAEILAKESEIAELEKDLRTLSSELLAVGTGAVDPEATPDRPARSIGDLRRELAAKQRDQQALRAQVPPLRRQLYTLHDDRLISATRVALENRLDLMNARAQLYDAWRALAVTANGLQGVFNVSLTNQIFTPPTTTNPFAFVDQAKQFSLVWNAELPLVRISERNGFRSAQINYQRQQRVLMNLEDQLKSQIRLQVRNLLQTAKIYDIQKINLRLQIRQRDNALRQILAPPTAAEASGAGAGGTDRVAIQVPNLISAQNGILQAQNDLIQTWVQYQTLRMTLHRDLGILPYDEWEAYHEFFPAKPAGDRRAAPRPDAGATERPAPADVPPRRDAA